jgi:hypothetical protein
VQGSRHWPDSARPDKQALVETLYGDAWNKLSFGPNPQYTAVDKMLVGQIPSGMSKAAQEALFEQQTIKSGTTVDIPGSRTIVGNTGVLVGESKPEKEKAEESKIGNQFMDFGLSLLGTIGEKLWSFSGLGLLSTIAEKSYEFGQYSTMAAIPSLGKKSLNSLLKDINQDNYTKNKFNDSTKALADMTACVALTSKLNDLSVRRAFPTFKIYFIEDDSLQSDKIDGKIVRAFDDFYSYSAIQEISIHKSEEIAADIATIRMTNIGGLLLRKRFGEQEDLNKSKERQGIFADTEKENPFERMILQDGVKVQIRLGYASDPAYLNTEFLGQIVEVSPAEDGKILEILCQGFGAELESVELGPLEDGPVFFSSQEVLSGSIIQDSIANFGRQDRSNSFNPAEIRHSWTGGDGVLYGASPGTLLDRWAKDGLDKQFNKYRFLNFPQDDNIYAPPPTAYLTEWDRWWNNACTYRPLKQTPWEIFKEHELRHPGYIAMAVPYGHEARMTMFFGPKGQYYWSRPPSALEIKLSQCAESNILRIKGLSSLKSDSVAVISDKVKQLSNESATFAKALIKDLMSSSSVVSVSREIGKLSGRYIPFIGYHYFDSEHHILRNEIRTSIDGTFNEVEVLYFSSEGSITDSDAEDIVENVKDLNMGEEELLATKLDENIPEKDIRSYREGFPSCITDTMARRYTQGLFLRTLRKSYKGDLCVIGKEGVKPYVIM